ncbi:hypothetical protein [Profundibacterium mesophilum]|uniref:Uncharacterized protein n=1 Tax=Profundibacterium mesophilum KAUST100406-0324 TaxID=1037889 RepID=A0A921NWD5_9RHOB|nr:hypothetical protein [Profundibacterium mesophilum]KAF0674768.1 hypothetical protein PMES_02844 [Profundibacterium mesophilum KAUST100406-0324]
MFTDSKVLQMPQTSGARKAVITLFAGFGPGPGPAEKAYKPDVEGRLWADDLAEIELMVRLYNPCEVISPLIAKNFDCIDLAQILQCCRFRGTYRAQSTSENVIPIVRDEIADLDLGFEFAILPEDRLLG